MKEKECSVMMMDKHEGRKTEVSLSQSGSIRVITLCWDTIRSWQVQGSLFFSSLFFFLSVFEKQNFVDIPFLNYALFFRK